MTEKQMLEIIKTIKADAEQSTIEYKNKLGAELKMYAQDFTELSAMSTDEVGEALKDTVASILKVLAKAGIEP